MSERPGEFFQIRTCWGSTLQVRHEDGLVVHRSAKRYVKKCSALYGYVSAFAPDTVFLVPSGSFRGRDLMLPGQPWRGRIRSLHRRRLPGSDNVELIEPQSGALVSARELDSRYGALGAVQADNDVSGPWEAFELIAASDLHPGARAAALSLDAILQAGGPAEAILACVGQPRLDYDAFQAVGRLLSSDEHIELANVLAGSPAAIADLAKQSPEDPYEQRVLPQLSQWLASGRAAGPFPRKTGVEDDPMERAWFDEPIRSLAGLCTTALRSRTAPRRRLAVLATMRNEGLYLVDWLAHHLAIGVEAFFIYTNDNDDRGTDAMLEAFSRAGVINLIRNVIGPGVRPQFKAYGHALQALPEILDYTWVAAIDADEYLRFNEDRFAKFDDFQVWHEAQDVDSIGLSWAVHTPNGQTRYTRQPVAERFPAVEMGGNAHIKSVFRPNRFVHSHCHFPLPPPGEERRFAWANGASAPPAEPFNYDANYDYAWVSHYYFKSVEEYLVRRLRNRGDGAVMARISEDMISEGLAGMVVAQFDRSAPGEAVGAAFANSVREHTARLQALPGVMDAWARCEAGFAEEARQMRRRLGASRRFQRPGSPEAALLALLDGRSVEQHLSEGRV